MNYHQCPSQHQQQHQCQQLPKQSDYHHQCLLSSAKQSHLSFGILHSKLDTSSATSPSISTHQPIALRQVFYSKYNLQTPMDQFYSSDQVNWYCNKILESGGDMEKITNSMKMLINEGAAKESKDWVSCDWASYLQLHKNRLCYSMYHFLSYFVS